MQSRAFSIPLCVGLFAVVLGVWSTLDLLEAGAAAQDPTRNLHAMEEIASDIEQLRELVASAHLAGEQPTETTQTWVDLAAEAKIGSEQVVEVNRLEPMPIPDTSYSRDDVFLKIRRVAMSELVAFLLLCRDRESGYTPASVHLVSVASPQENPPIERWDASLVLTRVLFTATRQ